MNILKASKKAVKKGEEKAKMFMPKELNPQEVKTEKKISRPKDFECGEGNNYEYFIRIA